MFEIIIFCVILLAVGYWVTLWMAGRREDVLHGQFVEVEPQAEPAPASAIVPSPAKPWANAVPPPATPLTKTASPPAKPSANPQALQSLLVSIKRELKDAARK
jgi:hypothetical protein